MAIILLVRHGHNDFVGKKLAGRQPGVHLNQKGKEQADQLAAALSGLPIRAVFASPLERTQETAAPIARAHDLNIETLPELNEIDFGNWQGKGLENLRKGRYWKQVQEHPADFRFPKGESFAEAQLRMVNCLMQISDAYAKDDLVVCVGHSDMIRLAVAHFLAMPLNDFQRLQIETASITVLYFSGGKAHFGAINHVLTFPENLQPADRQS